MSATRNVTPPAVPGAASRDVTNPARPASGRTERISSWGGALAAEAIVYRPETWEAVEQAIDAARRQGRPVVFRGAGRSYGDLLDSIVKLGLTYPAQWRVMYGS